MGSRRLPRQAAIAALLALCAAGVAAACGNGKATPTPTGTSTSPATATATASATATPDPVGFAPPTTVEDASKRLATLMATWASPCAGAAALGRAWGATCASGDLDGDGKADTALLVPLGGVGARTPHP